MSVNVFTIGEDGDTMTSPDDLPYPAESDCDHFRCSQGVGGCGRYIENQEKTNAEMLYRVIGESDVRGSDYKQGL